MTFKELWESTVKKSPALADDSAKITITVAQYRSALGQSFTQGHKHGVTQAAKLVGKTRKDYPDAFKDLFGHL